MAPPLGISPSLLTDRDRTKKPAGAPPPPPYQPVEVTWLNGDKLTVRMIRPGIAACHDNAVIKAFAPELKQTILQQDARLSELAFCTELDELLRQVEKSPIGLRLVEFLGRGVPIPDQDGSYGLDTRVEKMNPRTLYPYPRTNDTKPAGINVLILGSTHLGASTLWLTSSAGPGQGDHSDNGYGRFSVVAFHPRALLLVDDVAMPAEMILAHELIHSAHHLAGTHDDERLDKKTTDDIELLAQELAEATFDEKYRPETWPAVAQKTKHSTNPTKNQLDQLAFFHQMLRVARKKLTNPIPVATGPKGKLISVGGIDWEEHRTHGNDVALEWHDGMTVHGGQGSAQSRLERQSIDLAQRYLAQAAAAAAGKGPEAVTAAIERAEWTLSGRQHLRGITEIAIARELLLRHRVAYEALTGQYTVIHLAVARAKLPSGAFATRYERKLAPDFTFTAVDTRPLRRLRAALAASDPARNAVEAHLKKIGKAAIPQVAAQQLCGVPRATTPTQSTSAVRAIDESLSADATKLINNVGGQVRTKQGKAAAGAPEVIKLVEPFPDAEYSRGAIDTGTLDACFIAMVPCGTKDKPEETAKELEDLADHYLTEGFTKNQPVAERPLFGLVIGLNGHEVTGKTDQQDHIKKAIQQFRTRWDAKKGVAASFSIRVFGFIWRCRALDSGGRADQKTIPYGSIRYAILHHRYTKELQDQIDKKSGKRIYFHLGDGDVRSLHTSTRAHLPSTTAQGLFSAAATVLKSDSAPVIFSGGYTTARPDQKDLVTPDRRRKVLAWLAMELDLVVRTVLAEGDPRVVYFPEPNTFASFDPDQFTKNPFGEADQEGWKFVKSVREQHLEDAVTRFDARYAIGTDPTRIASKFDGEVTSPEDLIRQLYGSACALTQSHAHLITWRDQIEKRYLAETRGFRGCTREMDRITDLTFTHAPTAETLVKVTNETRGAFIESHKKAMDEKYNELIADKDVRKLFTDVGRIKGGKKFIMTQFVGTRTTIVTWLLDELLGENSLIRSIFPRA